MTRPRIAYFASVTVALVATIAGEFVFGRFSPGTRQQGLIAAAAARVEALPREFGPWRSEKDFPLEGGAVDMLQCAGYVNRTYVHGETGEVVTLAILIGPAGPLVAHTPEICFSSRDYEVVSPPMRRGFPAAASSAAADQPTGSAADELFGMAFRARTAQGERLRVYYGWSAMTGGWQAPDQPRLALGGQPLLYKLHIGAEADQLTEDDSAHDACQRFLTDALPEIDRLLFAAVPAQQRLPSTDSQASAP